jgi:hypothetical protein
LDKSEGDEKEEDAAEEEETPQAVKKTALYVNFISTFL